MGVRWLVAGYWRKGKKIMNKPIQYTDKPIGDIQLIADFHQKNDTPIT